MTFNVSAMSFLFGSIHVTKDVIREQHSITVSDF